MDSSSSLSKALVLSLMHRRCVSSDTQLCSLLHEWIICVHAHVYSLLLSPQIIRVVRAMAAGEPAEKVTATEQGGGGNGCALF